LLNSVFGIKTYSIYDDRHDIGANKTLKEVVGHEFLPADFDLARARAAETLYFIKTHDYPDRVSTDKVIYLLRDGRESTLSYFRYLHDYTSQSKSLGDVISGDTQFGSWGEHVAAWAPQEAGNTLLLRFEELIRDPLGLVSQIEEFAGIRAVSDHIPTFDELHKRGPTFFRSGKTDSWKGEYSEADHLAFWLRNYTTMLDYGYTSDMPGSLTEGGHLSTFFEVVASHLRSLEKRYVSRLAHLEERLERLKQVHENRNNHLSAENTTGSASGLPQGIPAGAQGSRAGSSDQQGSTITSRETGAELQLYTDPRVRGAALRSNEQGEACFARGELSDAEGHFLTAIQQDPGFADGYNNLGVVCWQNNDLGRALGYLAAGLRISPDHRELIFNTAEILKTLGKPEEAAVLYESFLTRYPGDKQIRDLAEELQGSSSVAAQQASHTSDVDRVRRAVVLSEEGEAAFRAGDLAGAEISFDQAYELDCNNADVCNNLAVLHWQNGDIEKSLRYLAEALEIAPGNSDVIVNAGQILATLGKVGEAKALCASFLERVPDDEAVARCLSELDRLAGQQDGDGVRDDSRLTDSGKEAQPLGTEFVDYSAAGAVQAAPRITVVIPSYNQGRFLEQTIRSVLDQNYPDLELIVMDGGSTDQSVEIIKKYQNRIAYWTSAKDKGQYWAVDAGFRRSSGEIMTWINSDDKLHPHALSTVASIFSQLKDVDWVTGTPNIMDEKGEQKWVCWPIPMYSRQYYLQKRYDYPNYIQQEGTFWRRSLWEKAGGRLKTSLRMAGDLELWMRFFRHARLHTANVMLGCFRQYGDQKTAHSLDLYRAEAEKELDRELDRFQRRREVVPTPAPIIEIHNLDTTEYLVTAIVSTYNSANYMRGCLEDLEAQTIAQRLEIIVVDSGSEQDERSIVQEFQQRYRNIRYIRTEARETIYSAWNRAISEARGKYLTNANTDDRHRPDAYERLVAELEASPGIALVYADAAVTRLPNVGFDQAPVHAHFKWPEFNARELFRVCYVGPQPMWRKSLHQKYGYFDARLQVAGDYDFWLRMAPGESFKHIPEILGLYLESASSLEHALAGLGARESEAARARNWPVAWGERPRPGGCYLVSVDPAPVRVPDSNPRLPLVSIVMPTKNRPELLGRALDSVLAQTYQNWELIVVNDGGESVHTLAERRDRANRIRCIELETSRGQAAARNLALAEARGEIVCYLDDDDLYLPRHLDTVVTELVNGSNDFVYTDAVVVEEEWPGGGETEIRRSNPYVHQNYSRDVLLVNNYIPINTWAHTRACVERCGQFDESLSCYEDWEFLLRLSAQYDFRHVRGTTVEVRRRAGVADNVSRQRLADTVDVYQEIYRRHGQGLTGDVKIRRRETLEKLQKTIASHTQTAGCTETVALGGTDDPARYSEYGQVRTDRCENAYRQWRAEHSWGEPEVQRAMERMSSVWQVRPSVHFVMTHVAGQEDAVADTLESLAAQVYGGWGLSVVSNAACPNTLFEDLAMLEWCQVQGNLMDGVNRVLVESQADWIGLIEAGDRVSPAMLYKCIDQLQHHADWHLIYTDEDRIKRNGERCAPQFKPEFDLEMLRALPYLGHFVLVSRESLARLGGFTVAPGAAAYEIALKVAECFGEQAIGHVAEVLVHREERVLLPEDERGMADNRRRCVTEHLERCQVAAPVEEGGLAGSHFIDYACSDKPAVDIIVPVRGTPKMPDVFLDSLFSKTEYPALRVTLLVEEAAGGVADWARDKRITVEVCGRNEALWHRLRRLVDRSETEYFLLMNPGAIAIQPSWLQRLVAHIQREEVAVVAPRLVSPDKLVVDGGIILGAGSRSVGVVAHAGLSLEEPGYLGRAQVVQTVSAVSMNCMLARKSALLGADEVASDLNIPLYQAVDFCLHARAAGKKILWTPHATLLFVGDGDQSTDDCATESAITADFDRLCSRWLNELANDPAYNPNLALTGEPYSVDPDFAPVWDRSDDSRLRVMGFGVGSYGSWQYRVAQPVRAMQGGGVADALLLPIGGKTPAKLPSVTEMERLGANSILLHNTIHDYCIDALAAYRKHNELFMVFGQDDLMFAIPPKNPFSKTVYGDMKKRMRKCLALVDRLVVTTEPLALAMSGMVDDIQIVPNYLDENVWGGLQTRRGVTGKPRVGWAGAPQHRGDLELLEQVVRETANEVDWVFMGMCPDFLKPYVKEVHEVVSFDKYPRKLATLNLDIAVAPLEHNRFNEAKSNLRILEYGMLGWPVIASAIEPYRKAPVCLVPNQPRAWVSAIRERAADLESAWLEGDRLRDWVQQNWLLRQHLDEWCAALSPTDRAKRGQPERDQAASL
jgi:glycosyltransferase involved in cell wall biosynthesis/tetratricopeptide (TPR) repeat protein